MNFLLKKPSVAESEKSKNEDESKEDETKKKKEIDPTLQSLDIPGLKSFRDARSKWAKAFWLFLSIACTLIFAQQLYKTITNYINSPIVSTYSVVPVMAMDFPIVYICPTSFLSSAYANKTPNAERDAIALKEEMGMVWEYADFLAAGDLSSPLPEQSNNPKRLDGDQSALNSIMRPKIDNYNRTSPATESDLNAEEFFKEATVPLELQTPYCEFRSSLFEKLPACKGIVIEALDPDFGKCYAVDVRGRQPTVANQGLILYFRLRPSLYPKSPLLSPMFEGVHLSVQRKYNFNRNSERIILGKQTYYRVDLSAQRQVFENFQHPYKQECVKNDSYPKFEIYEVPYTKQACLYECAARAMRQACGCLPPIDSHLYAKGVLNETKGFCKIKNLQCIRDIARKNLGVVDDLQKCRQQCQRPCENWRYSIKATSMELYPHGNDFAVYKDAINEKDFQYYKPIDDLIIILVSFSNMEYTEFKQDNSKTPDQMIADIGGEAGLWLGAGILTLVQIPLFLVASCGSCCKKSAKHFKAKKEETESEASENGKK